MTEHHLAAGEGLTQKITAEQAQALSTFDLILPCLGCSMEFTEQMAALGDPEPRTVHHPVSEGCLTEIKTYLHGPRH